MTGIILTYFLDIQALHLLSGYIFIEADDNWRNFVYNNRIDHKNFLPCSAGYNQQNPPLYDYVAGPLADGLMSDLELIKNGLITVEEFLAGVISIGDQISVHTEAAFVV